MAVLPSEIEQAGKLNADKCLVGRVVNVDSATDRYTFYLVCGGNPKEIIAVEAWSTMAPVAKAKLAESSVVHLQNVTLSQVKSARKKYSHSLCNYFVRFDKDVNVQPRDDSKDLPREIPIVSLAVARCLRQGLVDVIAYVSSTIHKPPEGKRTDHLQCLSLWQPGKKEMTTAVELTAWRDHCEEAKKLAADNVYVFRN